MRHSEDGLVRKHVRSVITSRWRFGRRSRESSDAPQAWSESASVAEVLRPRHSLFGTRKAVMRWNSSRGHNPLLVIGLEPLFAQVVLLTGKGRGNQISSSWIALYVHKRICFLFLPPQFMTHYQLIKRHVNLTWIRVTQYLLTNPVLLCV